VEHLEIPELGPGGVASRLIRVHVIGRARKKVRPPAGETESPMNYAVQAQPNVARLAVQARARFILRTYAHLFGAVMTFAAIDTALFVTDTAESVARAMMGMGQWVVLGGFLLGAEV
jgi:hypothetical protein